MKRFLVIALVIASQTTYAQKYWQQRVDTKIEVKLDDKNHFLHGYEEFTYTNNSPDTLHYIYVHLWPNAYKNDHTPFAKQIGENRNTAFYYADNKDRGYIDSLQFAVDGKSVSHSSSVDAPDVARIDLTQNLYPGEKIKVTTPFRVKLPTVFSRSGHTGQAYYVSQWFPKPAVYDHKGWHPLSYLDQGEFYSEFGSYDVSITVPTNYVLMATGNCEDAKENRFMDSLASLSLPASILHRNDFPASMLTTKTVRYTENNIHDFAWFADKRFVVRKDTAYNPGNDNPIITWSAFLPDDQQQWVSANEYLKDAVSHYGKWVGPYPYKTIKAVQGDMKSGGGMEYPTVTLIDRAATSKLKTVVIHEAGHNWFYGMLGSNEREHPWMDEGLNSFYEQKTVRATGKDSAAKIRKNAFDESLLYYEFAVTGQDQPINAHSESYKKTNYGIDVYYKTALMLNWLESYMGKDEFATAMKDYFNTWHFKHPYPEDFRAIMSKHTSKPLDWFFDGVMNTDQKIDFTITKARIKDGNTIVTVKNNSDISLPVAVTAYQKDSSVVTAWAAPFSKKATFTLPGTTWTKLRIADETPDAKTANDVYKRKALFHHFGLGLRPVLGVNRSYKEKVFLSPSFGNNNYDGIMAGLLLHNLTVPENRFMFAIAPVYAFNSEQLVGTGSIGYVWYPKRTFSDVILMADGKTFHNNETNKNLERPLYSRYIKIAPSILFTFKEKEQRSTVTRTLALKEYNISEEQINLGADSLALPTVSTAQNIYGGIRYMHINTRTFNPFSYAFDGHGNGDFVKLNLEGNVRIDYNSKGKALQVRGYLGKFFALNNNPAITNRYNLNASYGGENDYLYDGTYRGRNQTDGFSGQQISAIQEGGFKIPVHNGAYRSDNWMAAINLKTDLPRIWLPIRLFFDAGLIPNPSPGFSNVKSTLMMYDGGIELFLSRDVVSFYFPLIMSSDFRDYLSSTYGNKNVFARSISFTLHLQNINWLKTPGKLLKTVTN